MTDPARGQTMTASPQVRSSSQRPITLRAYTMTIKDKLVAGSQVGFGTAPLGNMFRSIPDAEAAATVRAAWEQGTRFFDTAPFYGAGLAELRLGEWLPKQPRDSYAISTKVGRLVLDEIEDPAARDQGEKAGV